MTPQHKLSDLPNLGPASERMLSRVGISTHDDLRRLGPVVAFLAVQQSGVKPSLNLLWAMYGAIHGVTWTSLTEDVKQSLRNEINELTGEMP